MYCRKNEVIFSQRNTSCHFFVLLVEDRFSCFLLDVFDFFFGLTTTMERREEEKQIAEEGEDNCWVMRTDIDFHKIIEKRTGVAVEKGKKGF